MCGPQGVPLLGAKQAPWTPGIKGRPEELGAWPLLLPVGLGSAPGRLATGDVVQTRRSGAWRGLGGHPGEEGPLACGESHPGPTFAPRSVCSWGPSRCPSFSLSPLPVSFVIPAPRDPQPLFLRTPNPGAAGLLLQVPSPHPSLPRPPGLLPAPGLALAARWLLGSEQEQSL